MVEVSAPAQAWLYHGNWVADCPRSFCGSVELVDTRDPGLIAVENNMRGGFPKDFLVCSNCKMFAEVVWPPDKQALWKAVEQRPVPQTRNWFPSGHQLAIRANLPHGQSVAELEQETREHGVDCS